ncbi:MAG: sulfite exporter TauE/SafE family protein [Bacteroidia bacterium]
MKSIAFFLFLSLIAEILGTVGGFGSSLFFVPIAGFFLDFHSVLGITALFHLSSNISKIVLFRKGVDKKLVLLMGIPAVIFVIAGAYASKFVDGKILQLSLGIFLVTLSSVLLIFKNLALKPTLTTSLGSGALSGVVAGLLGTGGAIRGLALAAFSLPKDAFIATSAIIDLAIDASRTVVYIANGYVHAHDLYLIAALFVVGFVGSYIGKRLLEKISEAQFKNIVLVLILFVGLATLTKLFVQA